MSGVVACRIDKLLVQPEEVESGAAREREREGCLSNSSKPGAPYLTVVQPDTCDKPLPETDSQVAIVSARELLSRTKRREVEGAGSAEIYVLDSVMRGFRLMRLPQTRTGQAKTMCALPTLGREGDLDLIGQTKKKQDLEGRDLLEIWIMAYEARDFRTIIVGNDEMGALQVDVAIEGVMGENGRTHVVSPPSSDVDILNRFLPHYYL
ncbi:hypothetical protein LTS15_007820 [Exophiala xenobiotica]|nr:hypothetical protein LTS15_007820 [Exophiala xenobiotica]